MVHLVSVADTALQSCLSGACLPLALSGASTMGCHVPRAQMPEGATPAAKVGTCGWPPRFLTTAHNSPRGISTPQTRAWGYGERQPFNVDSSKVRSGIKIEFFFFNKELSSSPLSSGFHIF